MKFRNLPRLRSLMKKLQAAPIDWTDTYVGATAGQEALDFVAMAAGLKPVYVSGRGFDDPAWRATLSVVAATAGFPVNEGPYWQAVPPAPDLPEWLTGPGRAALAAGRALYVTRSRHLAAEVAEVCVHATPTVAQEARLLGFPECCVAAHYATVEALERATLAMIEVRAGGEEAEMRRLAAEPGGLRPETDEERARLAAAIAVRPAPNTSLNLCDACAADAASPGLKLARTYADLARAVYGGRRG